MPRTKRWVFTPDRGGTPIPEPVRRRTAERLRRTAEQHFAGCYTRLEIRFHGQFCYIDAYTEPALPPAGRPGALGVCVLHLLGRALRAVGVPVGGVPRPARGGLPGRCWGLPSVSVAAAVAR